MHVISKITNTLPSQPIDVKTIDIIKDLHLADKSFAYPGSIDMLIGVELMNQMTTNDRFPEKDSLTFTRTVFGWVITGRAEVAKFRDQNSLSEAVCNFLQTNSAQDISKFWCTEEVPSTKPSLTEAEIVTKNHFEATTKLVNGRFQVKLPFKPDATPLGESKASALRRFLILEKRLEANPILHQQYRDFIHEFIDLEHLEEVPKQELDLPPHKCFYLPHHCVQKESTTTKLRVVFDASAKTSTKVSLNDVLLVGPKIQDDLFDHLIRFRCYAIGITGDIAKMYRQIALDKDDKDFHRLFWRDTPSDPIKVYRMTRVTYGIGSSGYHSIRSLQEAGKDSSVEKVIKRDFYVDDMLSGAHTEDEATQLIHAVSKQLEKHGMILRKFASNNAKIIEDLQPNLRENEKNFTEHDYSVKTLGIKWLPNEDNFAFTIKESDKLKFTKRSMLSDISTIFDPLGLLTPVTLKLKLIMQSCWVRGVDWDEELPSDVQSEFMEWRKTLPVITKLKIPRHILKKRFELHLFCDASELAYAACIYVRCLDTQETNLLVFKSKVAPLKPLTVPKLELCAAFLGCNLLKAVLPILEKIKFIPEQIHGWTDSTLVLSWLQEIPRSWNTFIANRVQAIQDILKLKHWKHVPSEDNPADLATRGVSADQLDSAALWWNGPRWLGSLSIPKQPQTSKTDTERKKSHILCFLRPFSDTQDQDRFNLN